MFWLRAKYLECIELPARDPYPASCLITVLAGTETYRLVGPHEMVGQLATVEALSEISLELRVRDAYISKHGGKGRAYRLSVLQILTEGKAK